MTQSGDVIVKLLTLVVTVNVMSLPMEGTFIWAGDTNIVFSVPN